jgi:hypothetical protein
VIPQRLVTGRRGRTLSGLRRPLSTRCTCAALACAATLVCTPSALAAGPWWHLDSGARPASIPAQGTGELVLTAENVGEAGAGGPVMISDALPAGLHATGIAGSAPKLRGSLGQVVPLSCSLENLNCEASGPIAPYDAIEVRIVVKASPQAKSGELNTLSVTVGPDHPPGLGRAAARLWR